MAITALLAAMAPDVGASLESGRVALKARQLRRAQAACLAMSPPLGSEETVAVAMFCGDVARARRRWIDAAQHYRSAAHAAVGDFATRRQAHRLRLVALRRAKRRRSSKGIRRVMAVDAKLRRILTTPARWTNARIDWSAIEDTYQRDDDVTHVALAQAVRLLVDASGGRPVVEPPDWRQTPSPVRQVFLRAFTESALAVADAEQAATWALQSDALAFVDLPEEERRYRRSSLASRACAALDAERGAGACARRQLMVHGYPVLPTFSGPGRRTPHDVAKVHDQVLVVLETCVLGVARAHPDRFRNVQVRLTWTVDPAGRVVHPRVRPSRLSGALQGCVDGPLAWFRYPAGAVDAYHAVEVPYVLQ